MMMRSCCVNYECGEPFWSATSIQLSGRSCLSSRTGTSKCASKTRRRSVLEWTKNYHQAEKRVACEEVDTLQRVRIVVSTFSSNDLCKAGTAAWQCLSANQPQRRIGLHELAF